MSKYGYLCRGVNLEYMEPENRIREAIKQIRLAADGAVHPDVIESLEAGSESLENALESLESKDED